MKIIFKILLFIPLILFAAVFGSLRFFTKKRKKNANFHCFDLIPSPKEISNAEFVPQSYNYGMNYPRSVSYFGSCNAKGILFFTPAAL
jgi:hypothetical protein